MSDQLIVRIDEDLKKRFRTLTRREGSTMSEKIVGMVREYVAQYDFPLRVDRVWEKIGSELKQKGSGPEKTADAIREVRSERPVRKP